MRVKFFAVPVSSTDLTHNTVLAPATILSPDFTTRLSREQCAYTITTLDKDDKDLSTYFTIVYNTILNFYRNNKDSVGIVLGGDHTAAIGSIAASIDFCSEANKKLGVLYFDAHLDSHTEDTSYSGNAHGMVLPAIEGKLKLIKTPCKNKFSIKNSVKFLGARDIEFSEVANIGTKTQIYTSENDIVNCVENAITIYDKIHISLDIDFLDQAFVPATSTPVSGGYTPKFLSEILASLYWYRSKILCLDIVEFLPSIPLDTNSVLTASVIRKLLLDYIKH